MYRAADTDSGINVPHHAHGAGSGAADYKHVDIEQTYVLEGRLDDDEGEVKAGEYVWRPAGSRHVAKAPEGALLLGMFLRPNKFL